MAEGRELFRGKNIEPRIVDNISLIYASCMAFDPTKKEYIIEILNKLLSEQQDDFDVNSTGQQFIKALGQYSSSRFSHIYTDEVKNTVIF